MREVHGGLSSGKDTGYTTTLKILQKMTEKGLVVRDERERSHIYKAALRAEGTQRQLVRDLVSRAFGGSAIALVQQALSDKPTTAGELAEIRALLDELEANNRKLTRE